MSPRGDLLLFQQTVSGLEQQVNSSKCSTSVGNVKRVSGHSSYTSASDSIEWPLEGGDLSQGWAGSQVIERTRRSLVLKKKNKCLPCQCGAHR